MNLNLDEFTPNDVEASGPMPVGIYPAELVGACDATASSGNTGSELTFRIIGGRYDGKEIKERIWSTGKPAVKARQLRFASRLGLVKEVKEGDKTKYELAKPTADFVHCLGAKCLVKTAHETFTGRDGREGAKIVLDFFGIYRPGEVEPGVTPPKSVGQPKAKAEPAKANLADEI